MQKSINELKKNVGDAEKANFLGASVCKASKVVVDVLHKQLVQVERDKNQLQMQLDEAKRNEKRGNCVVLPKPRPFTDLRI